MGRLGLNILRGLGLSAALCGVAGVAAVAAASGTGTALTTEHLKLGKVIATSTGHAVYLFSRDSGSHSSCTGACASAWPPLTGKGSLAKGSGLNPKLLGTVQRGGGQTQVTYNHHPLYLFAHDKVHAAKGEGQKAFGGRWYLLGSRGAAVKPKKPQYCNSVCQGY